MRGICGMRYLVAICAFVACMHGLIQAQVQTPLHVGAFGGMQGPLPRLTVPPELKSFIPMGFVLRYVLPTKMSTAGESVFLYDNGEKEFPEVHLHALRNARQYELFDGVVSGIAGLSCLPSATACELLTFAYHRGGNLADTTFAIFGHQNGAYRQILQQEAFVGRM